MAVKTTSEYIDLLNQAVEREFKVSVQYFLQHAKMEKIIKKQIPENILLNKTTYDAVGKILHEIAIAEMKHAGAIMERIYYLGGEATTKSGTPIIGETISEFAKLGVEAEEEALVLYRKIIDQSVKIGDWETHEMFKKIYVEEEEHLFKFQEYAKFQDEKEEPDKVPLSEWRKIFTDDYLVLLNKAVAGEMAAIIQYTNQHEKAAFLELRRRNTPLETVEDTNFAAVVSKTLKDIFMVEMQHLEKISERIYLVDGEAVTKPDPVPVVGKTPLEMLQLDHKLEADTIWLYRQIITEATKRGDSTTRKMFEDIVLQEEDHYWTFDDYVR
jgi:bacterioferritin